jgi:trimethylamine:corrinoid methyltransferase-like protein
VEKLVIDAEAIAMVKRLLDGVHVRTEPLATAMFAGIDFKADFLKKKVTRQLFAKEQYLPSPVIDRGSLRSWQDSGRQDAFRRARIRVDSLVDNYVRPVASAELDRELQEMMAHIANRANMEKLPPLSL